MKQPVIFEVLECDDPPGLLDVLGQRLSHLPAVERRAALNVIYVYVTAGMDISAGSVPDGPNLTGRMDPWINTSRTYERQICLYFY